MNDSSKVFETEGSSLIDTHCHLDDKQFADDLDDVLANSRRANVTRWILIGYDPERWDDAIALARQHEGMYHTVGVHPSRSELWNQDVAARLLDTARESGAVGIGEIGLDFYRDNAALDVQAPAFTEQLDIAITLNLPVVIHMRSAETDMLELLEARDRLPVLIFHSFDGSAHIMDYALETGSYIGIGGLATRQKSDMLRAQLKRVPMERILLETDSPYLVPARQKDRRNQPAQVATIASMMAPHLDTTPERLAEITTENAVRVFGLRHD